MWVFQSSRDCCMLSPRPVANPGGAPAAEIKTLKPPLPEDQAPIGFTPSLVETVLPRPLFSLPIVIIMAAAAAVIAPFLYFGIPSGHDFGFHVDSWMEVVSQWKEGVLFPRWAAMAHFGYGEPRFVFYPPASWLMGAALGAALPWSVAPAAYVWLALTFSGCSMFLLARQWMGRNDAIFAAAFYAANPYYLLVVYWRSAYAELLAGALLPLLLMFVLRLAKDGRRWIIPLGLVVAAAWLTNAPSAVMVNYSLALLLVLLAVSRRSPRILLQGALSIAIGLALAAFYIIPASYEQRWVNISQILELGVSPSENFLFTAIADPRHNAFNWLVSCVALAEMALLALALLSRRRWRQRIPQGWWIIAAWSGVCALALFPITAPLWNHLPELRFMQIPWRWLLCFDVGFVLLITISWRRWTWRFLAYAGMLAVLALAGRRFQTPWWDHAPQLSAMRQSIEASAGYEGTDEYTPEDADGYEIDHNARHVIFRGKGVDQIHVTRWDPESKIFTAQVSAPGDLVLRLFSYPAWQTRVNGRVVATGSDDRTGQITIPVGPGNYQVSVAFIRTPDRTIGGIISLTALLLVSGVEAFRRKKLRLDRAQHEKAA